MERSIVRSLGLGALSGAVLALFTLSGKADESEASGDAASAAGEGGKSASSIDRLAWLQGCWEIRTPKRTVEECWMRPAAGSMIGMSRTISGGKFTGHEFLILRASGDTLEYEAHPSGQAATTFVATEWTDSLIIFENPEHDFPQRIGYRRAGPDSLAAWIEGTVDGKLRKIDFPYERVSCEGR